MSATRSISPRSTSRTGSRRRLRRFRRSSIRPASRSKNRIRTSSLIVNLTSPDGSVRSGWAIELRVSSNRRSAQAHRRRRRRAVVRRTALFDADLARSGQTFEPRHHRRRRTAGHHRTEYSGGGRQDRPVSRARRHRLRNAGQCRRPAQRPEQFGEIAVRADTSKGSMVRLKDVARIELGALQYTSSAFFGKDPDHRPRDFPGAGLQRPRPAEERQGEDG